MIDRWAAMWENVPSHVRLTKATESSWVWVQSNYSFRCPHEENLQTLLSKMNSGKILIRLREREHVSEVTFSDIVAPLIQRFDVIGMRKLQQYPIK